MIRSLGIAVRRAPYGTISAGEALRHAAGAITYGVATTFVLLEDGVYVARADQAGERIGFTSLAEPLAQFAKHQGRDANGLPVQGRVVAHGPSLAARGLRGDKLVDGVEIVDDAALAELLGACDAVLTY